MKTVQFILQTHACTAPGLDLKQREGAMLNDNRSTIWLKTTNVSRISERITVIKQHNPDLRSRTSTHTTTAQSIHFSFYCVTQRRFSLPDIIKAVVCGTSVWSSPSKCMRGKREKDLHLVMEQFIVG